MLREILAITGKPGLFKIVSHSGKTLIVEDLVSGKRFPVSARERVVSLGDIAMYTESEDKPLGEILDTIYTKEDGKKLDVKEIISSDGLKTKFEEYIPDFDKDRVHDSDVKKLFTWYNLLVDKGYTKFTEEEQKEESSKEEEALEEPKSDKEKEPK
ncbi:MAG: DUF5606 domain-containing protein [Muribaculaceae bacterium]|nr:DUF5606 domain-containing protein [Muribaculaceae bacterium]